MDNLPNSKDLEAKKILDRSLENWIKVFTMSFLRVENKLRKEENLNPISSRIPIRIKEPIRLLNLRVWSLRYHVSLEFILQALWPRYRRMRKPMMREHGRESVIFFSLTAQLTGEASRAILERVVSQTYPGGENYRAYLQTIRDKGMHVNLAPILTHEFTSARELIDVYTETIQHRKEKRTARYNRPWRDNPWK